MKSNYFHTRRALTTLLMLMFASATGSSVSDHLLKHQVRCFTTDVFGNVYIADNNNTVFKYDASGTLIIQSNYKIYGDLAWLDAGNPFELYWYYRDQQKLLLTDNQLSTRGVVDLSGISALEVTAVCRSYDNGFWVFDGSNSGLLKLNKELRVMQESMVAATWTDSRWFPQYMVEDGRYVYVLDSSKGIAMFDVFGQFYKTVALQGISSFQIFKNRILYVHNGFLCVTDPVTGYTDTLLSVGASTAVRIEKEHRYSLVRGGIQLGHYP